ncbi:hypothetical protein RvY_15545 [Ramazzottius varieornatus]|uniref:Uncharacterized protein n=1 Tax=Ramazzottius varieornatus TaxID=947166 RepID=A0A1D1W232_RAMVA|nr:hypothetical protein RvY_15545 [Ramazzottius varieornatus]
MPVDTGPGPHPAESTSSTRSRTSSLERPKAAKLKPGQRTRSPFLSSELPLQVSSLSSNTSISASVKPIRPNVAYTQSTYFSSSRPSSRAELSHVPSRIPSPTPMMTTTRSISEEEAANMTRRIEARYSEKLAARKSKMATDHSTTSIPITQPLPSSVSTNILADRARSTASIANAKKIANARAVKAAETPSAKTNPNSKRSSGKVSNVGNKISSAKNRSGSEVPALEEPFTNLSLSSRSTDSLSSSDDYSDDAYSFGKPSQRRSIRVAESSGFDFRMKK